MSVLAILYWVILVLAAIGYFTPWPRISNVAVIVLFALIGLRVFRMPLT